MIPNPTATTVSSLTTWGQLVPRVLGVLWASCGYGIKSRWQHGRTCTGCDAPNREIRTALSPTDGFLEWLLGCKPPSNFRSCHALNRRQPRPRHIPTLHNTLHSDTHVELVGDSGGGKTSTEEDGASLGDDRCRGGRVDDLGGLLVRRGLYLLAVSSDLKPLPIPSPFAPVS